MKNKLFVLVGFLVASSQAVGSSTAMSFVRIPHGSFMMGSPNTESGRYSYRENQHAVTISQDFEMQVTPVTQEQYLSVMGPANAYPLITYVMKPRTCDDFTTIYNTYACPNNPISNVPYSAVQKFIDLMNARNDGYSYRLPTEAEWEYAARAGSTTAYYFGSTPLDLGKYAWYGEVDTDHEYDIQTHPVAKLLPNAFGLYDMIGNVAQWTSDLYDDAPEGGIDPRGPAKGPKWGPYGVGGPKEDPSPWSYHVVRGASSYAQVRELRSANRNYFSDGAFADAVGPFSIGFRLVRVRK